MPMEGIQIKGGIFGFCIDYAHDKSAASLWIWYYQQIRKAETAGERDANNEYCYIQPIWNTDL